MRHTGSLGPPSNKSTMASEGFLWVDPGIVTGNPVKNLGLVMELKVVHPRTNTVIYMMLDVCIYIYIYVCSIPQAYVGY
jgi:hypothetical protein